ncbi:hypothetical protein [Bacillus chungangensis]|uniref:Uncharacterized protein n=1 Tax=Bacillus chungangensis TaxID=587633 RepID=A0ABT9WWL9_9BACI|nr:hypothetical protein [Bacillus chungangensis]MDQ0177135.1 hypothetical protein [Bacillus chungangensis]
MKRGIPNEEKTGEKTDGACVGISDGYGSLRTYTSWSSRSS